MPTQGAYRELTSHEQLHDLPGAPARHPLPHRVGQDRAGRDPERHARDHALDRRDPRDPPAGRRLGASCPRRCGRTSAGSRCWSRSHDAIDATAGSIALDIDGTVLREDGSLGDDAVARGAAASRPGHEVMLATGRSVVDDPARARPARAHARVRGLRERRDHARPRPRRRRSATRAAFVETFDPTRGAHDHPRTPRGRELRGRGRRPGCSASPGTSPTARSARSRQKVEFDELLDVQATRVVVISPGARDRGLPLGRRADGPAQGQLQRRLDGVARHRARRRQQGDRRSSGCASWLGIPRDRACWRSATAATTSTCSSGRRRRGPRRRDGAGARRGARRSRRAHRHRSRRRRRPSPLARHFQG